MIEMSPGDKNDKWESGIFRKYYADGNTTWSEGGEELRDIQAQSKGGNTLCQPFPAQGRFTEAT